MSKFKFENYIAIFIFLVIIAGPMLIWPFISDRFDYDTGEKRNKVTMSEIIDINNITHELETYFNDRVPFRSLIINFKKNFESSIEKPYADFESKHFIKSNKKHRDTKYLAVEIDGEIRKYMDDAVDIHYNHGLTAKEFDVFLTGIKYPLKTTENQNVILGQSNWLYLNDINIDLYTGKLSISDGEIKKYVSDLEYLVELCKKAGKRITFLIVPEKEEIYPEYMPTMDIVDDVERTIHIRNYMVEKKKDIRYIYPKEELLFAKPKYLVYRKYDTHWNDVGAYIAAKKLFDIVGKKSEPLRNIKLEKINSQNNELGAYGGIDLSRYPKSFEYIVDYKPGIYTKFENVPGKEGKVSVKAISDTKNEDKLLLIGDSFLQSLVKFLYKEYNILYVNSFQDVIEQRIDHEAFVNEVKDADNILIELVERNDITIMPALCYKLSAILKSVYGEKK